MEMPPRDIWRIQSTERRENPFEMTEYKFSLLGRKGGEEDKEREKKNWKVKAEEKRMNRDKRWTNGPTGPPKYARVHPKRKVG